MRPGALLPYKDTLLLIANEGFISFFDITKFPPLTVDFKQDLDIIMSESTTTSQGNNSICSQQDKFGAHTSMGLSWLSMNQENVTEKTLSYSSATFKLLGSAFTSMTIMATVLAL